MTQFASTLYPQTNPTNQVLLNFRECCEISGMPVAVVASAFVKGWDELHVVQSSAREQGVHSRRVLTRLASLSG